MKFINVSKWVGLFATVGTTGLAGFSANAGANRNVAVPIYQTPQTSNPNGVIRQSIMVQIGNTQVEALLDTGSTGLRVLADALDPSDYSDSGQPTQYSFSAGIFSGDIANANVTIGTLSGAVDFQIVPAGGLSCPASNPSCAFSQNSDSILGSGVNGPYKAIIGVSLKADILPNPLAVVADPNWLVTLALPGDCNPGTLLLNPKAKKLRGFTAFQLSPQAQGTNGADPLWADNQIPMCVITDRINVCSGGSLDTGAFNLVDIPKATRILSVPAGTAVTLRLTNADGVNVDDSFNVGDSPGTVVHLNADQSTVRNLNTGPLVFYSNVVSYDIANGVIGLKGR